jgi:hypothetical protein
LATIVSSSRFFVAKDSGHDIHQDQPELVTEAIRQVVASVATGEIYPYLLRGMEIVRPNQVWAMDITYIPMACGFVYLAVVLDLQSIGRQLLVLRAGSPQAIDLVFATLVEQRAGALLVGGDPFLVGRSQQLVAMAARHAIPAIYDFRESALLGGLMSYGSNLPNNYRQLGVYAGRLLKGESAADLPVMHPAIFDFTINLVTATNSVGPIYWCVSRCSVPLSSMTH